MSRIVWQPREFAPDAKIIRVTAATKRARNEWSASKRPQCMTCGKRGTVNDLGVDHIIGGKGRSDEPPNWLLVGWACCHSDKHDRPNRLAIFIAAKRLCDPKHFDAERLRELRGGEALPDEWDAIYRLAISQREYQPVF